MNYTMSSVDCALMQAVKKDDFQKVKELIHAGANVHTCEDERAYWGNGKITELRRLLGYATMPEILINGGKVNYFYREETPLHVACSGGSTSVVKELLKCGACVNASDCKGNTPLNRAVKDGQKNVETIKVLLENGADINLRSQGTVWHDHRFSPLDNAILRDLSVAKVLVKMYLIKTCNFNKIIHLMPGDHYERVNEVMQYFDECVSEIVQMKTEAMNHHTSLYDLLLKEAIVILPTNSDRVKQIQDIMIEKYPIYHDIVADKIDICLARWRLVKKLREVFFFIELETSEGKQIVGLDSNSVEIIASYLSTEDISNLVDALSVNGQNNDKIL